MRVRFALLAATLALPGGTGLVSLSLTHGQAPTVAPPVVTPAKPLAVAPAPAPGPVPKPRPAPEKKAGPDLKQLSIFQRQMYASARRGAAWLSRMNDVKGRFVPGWVPELNTGLGDDSLVHQAGAAFALARAARYLREDGHDARARQAILALLEDTALSAGGKVRQPLRGDTQAERMAVVAFLVLAIHELPTPGDELLGRADQLCEYLRGQQLRDGSFRLSNPAADRESPPAVGEVVETSGPVLYALARSQVLRPAAWKTEAVRRAVPVYLAWWREHRCRDFVGWHSAACTEAYLATKQKGYAEAVFEMCDWLCGQQYDRIDPKHPNWFGGFPEVVDGKTTETLPDVGAALGALALVEARRVTAQEGDLLRDQRYQATLERALQFVATLQFTDGDTQHFADWYRPRLLGGFHFSSREGHLRLDYTQHAVAALVHYLEQAH